ncbi:MAG TPA: glycoside hydrolase family 130 protein [Verrucomicrobiae bacterium]|nr:glycoside hydrolase family 130 protein [Verrucomicrobiae bacterium]
MQWKSALRWWVFLLFLLAAIGAGATVFHLPFSNWSRLSQEPVLSPEGNGFESAGTFNPAAVEKDHKIILIYRAQDTRGVSSLGYASSGDGIHFTRRAKPVLTAEAPYEQGGGVEDPRIVKISGLYYLTYTGYRHIAGQPLEKGNAQLCLATSRDLIHWERHGVIMPSFKGAWNKGWTKSGAIVPEKINGKYWMYYLGVASATRAQMGVASSPDLLHWTDALDHPILEDRPGKFDAHVVEPGPPPVILPSGILLIYNGASDKDVYSTGWALFDKSDPTKVIARADSPLFAPQLPWEETGQVPNVVFVEGLVRQDNRWLFYYGGADKYVGVAAAPIP